MKVVPQAGPVMAGNNVKEIGPSSRERALGAFMEGQRNSTQTIAADGTSKVTANTPVLNPTQVAPEEMSATQPARQIDDSVETPVEAAEPEVKAAPEPKEDPLSSQYALLARKERALRAKAQAEASRIKADREAFESEKRAMAAREQEIQSRYVDKNRLRSDLPNILAELGLSSQEISNIITNAPTQESVALNSKLSAYETQIKSLTDKLESMNKSYEDKERQSYDAALNQIHFDVKKLVSTDPSYELIKETGASKAVVTLIEKVYKGEHPGLADEYPEGTLLDLDTAAALVENELLDRYLKTSKLKKIQEKLSVKNNAAPSNAAKVPGQSQPMKTLTNAVASSKKLSAKERAILAYKGQLK